MLRLNSVNIMWLFQIQTETSRTEHRFVFSSSQFPDQLCPCTWAFIAVTDGRDGKEPQGKHHMVLFSRLSRQGVSTTD
jgi:hypothetical protein